MHPRGTVFRPVVAGLLVLAAGTLLVAGHAAAEPPALVEMEVADLLSVGQPSAPVVVLKTRRGQTFLPIFIGDSEALAIALRISRQQPPRPLTHDLLERVMQSLNGKLVKVHIESVRQAVFLGRIYLRQGGRVISLDARPSDSIALALGAGVPIYASRAVIEAAGVSKDQIRNRPAAPSDGETGEPSDGRPRPERGSSL